MSEVDAATTKQRMTAAEIASVCHEANRAYCATQNDDSQLSWEKCPVWQRASAINGVLAIVDNPSITPEALHESWMKEKVDGGWVHGEKKDPNAEPPTHPCIVPYSQLPPGQQVKDHLFHAIVHALAF